MLTDKDLRDLVRDASRTLQHVATQYRRVDTPDGAGGVSTEWELIGWIPCFVVTVSKPVENVATGKIVHTELVNCLLHRDAEVLPTDHLKIDGKTFEVVSLVEVDPNRAHKRAILERRDDAGI